MGGTVRRPPPPASHHRTCGGVMDPKSNGNEQGKSEIVAGENKGGVAAVMARTYYHRRCKRKILTSTESLPDEIVFEILVRLSAQDIYEVTRLVCPKWYRMIHTRHFINEHLKLSTNGLLIQMPQSEDIVFLSMREGRTEISNYSYKFSQQVWNSCNGLGLVADQKDYHVLYIANPVTKQHFGLPPFFQCIIDYRLSSLAYVAASMEYKVVVTYPIGDLDSPCYGVAILTVGVDESWRHVNTDHLSCAARRLLKSRPVVTEGFMHWCGCKESCVVTLNVETETLREIHIPQGYGEKIFKKYLSAGSYLSFTTVRSKFSWEVWEMKPESGEWTKLSDIDLETEKGTIRELCGRDCRLTPVAWLKYKEVMVFLVLHSKFIVVYDVVHKQKIHQFETCGVPSSKFIVHVNSLVWLDT